MRAANRPAFDPAMTLVAIGCFAVGLILGISALLAQPPAEIPLKTNMELLGEVTTVVDDESPLVQELKRDDRVRAEAKRDEWR